MQRVPLLNAIRRALQRYRCRRITPTCAPKEGLHSGCARRRPLATNAIHGRLCAPPGPPTPLVTPRAPLLQATAPLETSLADQRLSAMAATATSDAAASVPLEANPPPRVCAPEGHTNVSYSDDGRCAAWCSPLPWPSPPFRLRALPSSRLPLVKHRALTLAAPCWSPLRSHFFTSGTDKVVRRFASYDDEQPLEAEEHQDAISAMAVKVGVRGCSSPP